jgi:GAF domain-containing protein
MIQHATLDAVLTSLCERVEALAPGSAAGLTICNAGRTHIERALFPTLPPTYAAAITNVPLPIESPFFGSCVQSVSRGEIFTSADITNDDRFDPQWKKLCLDHGVRSLQSRPIYVQGKPFGTFVLAYREPRRESDWDAALMAFAADAAGEALSSSFHGVAVAPPKDGAPQHAR